MPVFRQNIQRGRSTTVQRPAPLYDVQAMRQQQQVQQGKQNNLQGIQNNIDQLKKESDYANSWQGLTMNTLKGLIPGQGTYSKIGNQITQNPVDTLKSVGSGVYQGVQPLINLQRYTNPASLIPQVREQYKKTDEMLGGYQPQNQTGKDIQQGFNIAGSNVPYLVGGEVTKAVPFLKNLPRLANYLGFTGTSQVLSDKKITDIKGRGEQAVLDTLMFGLTGGLRKPKVEAKIPQSSIAPKEGKVPPPGQVPEVKTQNPQLNESLSYKNIQAPKKESVNTGEVSDFYNVDNLKISDEAKQNIKNEISNSKSKLEETVGKTLTNKEVLDTANMTGKVLDKVVTRAQTEEKIASNLRLRQQIAKSAQDGKIDSSFIDLWIKDKAAGEDIARQLQARSIVADPQEAGAINSILDSIYKVNKNADEIIAASKGVDFNDVKQVTEFYRKFVKPKAKDWIDLLRYNSMLSSPNTHMVNATSNIQGSGILAPIEKTLTGMIDATRSALTGSPRKYYAGEGIRYAKGYFSNITTATKRFIGVMRGDIMNANPDVRNIPLSTGGFKRGVENVLSVPLKLLEAADQFFSALSEGGAKSSLTYRASKGVKVGDIGNLAKEEAAYRLFRDSGNPTQGHVLSAIDSVTNVMMQLRNSQNPVVSTIAKFTLPFVRTPMNIFKQGIEYSPVGITTLWGASNKTEQISKMIIGMTSAAGAATLLGQDRLTWAEPTSAKQRNDFRAAGRQAYAIKIGDKWVSYAKLHPALAFNFALVAALDDSLNKNKLTDDQAGTILDTFAKYGNFLADQSYAKNIGDFLSATKGSAEQYTSFFSNYPQQLIPLRSLMGWINRLIDPYQRKVDTDGAMLDQQMQQIMSTIPGLSQNVPTRNDQFGQPVENQNPLLNAISPYRVTNINPQMDEFWNMQQEQRRLDAAASETHTKQKDMIMQGLQNSDQNMIRDAFNLDPIYAKDNFKSIIKEFQMQGLDPETKIQMEKMKFEMKKANPFYTK